MKKTSDETYILAYAYGCGYIDLPIDNEFIIKEVTKQREFWNRLLDIQLSIDNEIKSQMVKDVPELKKTYKKIEILSQKMDRLCDDRRTIRREVKKLTATPELDEQIKAIAKERYEVKKTAWDLEKNGVKKISKPKKKIEISSWIISRTNAIHYLRKHGKILVCIGGIIIESCRIL